MISAGQPAIAPTFAAENIYRRYFVGGIVVILSAGALWGAYLLWQVSRAESFTGVSIQAINAHGHAQIFGWVGLFIMGFAYQALPRMWGVPLAGPHLAVMNFVLLMVSLGLSTAGTALAETWSLAISAVVMGGLLQIIAVVIFMGQLAVVFARSKERRSPSTAFVFAAMAWFAAMSAMNLWHGLALMQAESHDALLVQISTYQAALRDMQIHGLALCMILGVSMRFFPGMFGLAKTSAARGWWAFGLIQIAIIGEVVLLIGSRWTDSTAMAGGLIAPWLMLAVAVGLVIAPWRLWRPMPKRCRSGKFVRIAFAWLTLSLAMLLFLPVYMVLRDMVFSHAYYGAMRHAITVGFISMMIMGVAGRVVPELRGWDVRTLRGMWGPFVLVNIGCAMRVASQVLTDWNDSAFDVIGFSGMLEVTGLAWWGVSLVVLMYQPQGPRQPCGPKGSEASLAVIDPEMRVNELAEAHPQVRAVLGRLGFDSCCMGEKTLAQASILQGLEPQAALRELQALLGNQNSVG